MERYVGDSLEEVKLYHKKGVRLLIVLEALAIPVYE